MKQRLAVVGAVSIFIGMSCLSAVGQTSPVKPCGSIKAETIVVFDEDDDMYYLGALVYTPDKSGRLRGRPADGPVVVALRRLSSAMAAGFAREGLRVKQGEAYDARWTQGAQGGIDSASPFKLVCTFDARLDRYQIVELFGVKLDGGKKK